jgi:hypothetical protein
MQLRGEYTDFFFGRINNLERIQRKERRSNRIIRITDFVNDARANREIRKFIEFQRV